MTKTEAAEDLLPTGSIDPALREGDFYIVYDRDSGSVTDVFYAERSMGSLMSSGFDKFYEDWAKSSSDRLKQKGKMLVGWYNGEAAEGGIFKEGPDVEVTINNEEELTVTVVIWKRDGSFVDENDLDLVVELGEIANLNDSTYNSRKKKEAPETVEIPSGGISRTWVLDSLTAGKFQELDGTGIIPGDDFTVTATVTSVSKSFPADSDSDTNNSLFQRGSGSETAYIKYLRHLQNLDSGFSGVKGKTKAEQTADIRCKDNETYGAVEEYKSFTPISNTELKSYNGGDKEIRNLYVKGTGPAGLFKEVSGMTLQDIRLVNATVKAENGPAGALAGEANGATIEECWVYWDTDETVTDLKAVLGSDAEGAGYHYQITGEYAGGLVGEATGKFEMKDCLAATLVRGEERAGGLIGNYSGGKDPTITNSYADCYLTGGEKANVAGLVGTTENGTITLTNCYAAGFIMGGNQAAGLCLGKGTTKATNVYSVMRYPGRDINAQFTFLTGGQASDSFTNTHFLYNKTENIQLVEGKTISGVSFEDMSADEFVTKMGTSFQRKSPENSHPYELRPVPLVYDYPGLKNLPHYGDWGRELAALSLAYYENDGGTNRVSGIGIRDLNDSTTKVTKDGYALLLRKEEGDDGKTVNATFSYLDKNGIEQTKNQEYELKGAREIEADGKKDFYYALPLPDELVTSNYAEEQFFRYIKFALTKEKEGEKVTYEGEAFFNPHFAETVQTARLKDGAEGGWNKTNETDYAKGLAKVMGEIKIRTPRHLYDLSRFEEYYTRRNVFHQILDLDYSTYTWYSGMLNGTPFEQRPIGSGTAHFKGTYNGDHHVIKKVAPQVSETSQRRYAGLFGYSEGALRNIVYEMDPGHQVTAYLGNSAQSLYVGALAGGSSGTIENCAVSGVNLRAGASGVKLYVGGLVGRNEGTIRNCAAESARLSANCFQFASIYMGGLVGENRASITTSYAVGRIDTEVDTTIATARICGFVGWNYGSISNSYAAVDLRSSGDSEKVEAYGFCGVRVGAQSGNAYLDQGNFTYREAAYAANYSRTDDKAASTRYTDLATKEKAENLGMGTIWKGEKPDSENEFPYPAAVKDEKGNYVHYGKWPEPMPLGEMGVFYWEKMVDAKDSKSNPTYHMSALAVDPVKETITKRSTLSEVHNDGRVVTEYGYGYYADKNIQQPTIGESNIVYRIYSEGNQYKGIADTSTINQESTVKYASVPLAGSKGAADALKEQTVEAEKYDFYCWTSYHEGGRLSWVNGTQNGDRKEGTTQGLSLYGDKEGGKIKGGGVFRLNANGLKLEFGMTPMFADSLSVKNSGWLTVEDEKLKDDPGTESNPFQIRCGAQLQQINWMNGAWTDTCVGQKAVSEFPYLSGSENDRKYVWKQTHDVDWVAEGNICKWPNVTEQTGVFMGIAQTRANGNSLPGWFGGSYDGQNYTIKNLKIGKNGGEIWGSMDGGAYDPNCMGLFGAVRNATLKNIVMFSETGEDVVNVLGRKNNDKADAWYAGGVLAGLAWDSEITNCAVAGYTIRDLTKYARTSGDVGGAIGGLVGMTNGEMKGCTASAAIEILCDHSKSGNTSPIRVGGLVGSTTSTVTNCYTGGEIKVTARNASIYAGRLIGGVGMGPFGGEDKGAKTTVSNCYSYLTLPSTGGVVKEVYNIGGRGRANNNTGTVTLSNNYYLSGTADATDGERAVTYRQFAGLEMIDGRSIYEKLNAGQVPAPYSPVTSKIGDLNVAGRFSYVPKDRLDLQGMDYPFPTVLTQTRVSDGMVFNVHYGGWKLSGIERANGNQPIELDMFAARTGPDAGTWRTHTETLTLSEGVTGGTWSVEVSDGSVVTATVVDGQLTVEALKASDTPVTVTVKYRVSEDVEYSMPITVYVTANVDPRPRAVSLFPNDAVRVPLGVIGKRPDDPNASDENRPKLDAAGLTVVADGVKSLAAALEAKLAEPEAPGEGQPPATPAIDLASKEGLTENAKVNVTYTYTQNGYTAAEKTDQIDVVLLALPEGVWSRSEDGKTDIWTMDFKDRNVENLKAEFADADSIPEGFTAGPDGTDPGTAVTLTKPVDAQFPAEDVKLKVTLTMDGLEHTLTIAVPKPEPPDAEADASKAPNTEAEGGSEILSQEGGTPLAGAEEKVEERPGGVDPDSPAVPDGVHDGGGVGADVGGLQRGQDQEQPGGTAEVPDPVLSPDPDL